MKNGDLPATFTMRLPGSVKQWKSLIKWESVDTSTSPPSVTQFQCMGVWDTGATSTVISGKVATDNGLQNKLIGYQTIHTANGSINSPVCLLKATLMNDTSYVTIPNLSVSIADMGVDALIGMDIISLGDNVSWTRQKNQRKHTNIPISSHPFIRLSTRKHFG